MAGSIKHRHVSALPDSGADIDTPEWNDSLVVSGGTDGQYAVRDAASPDGWKFLDPPVQAPDDETRYATITAPVNSAYAWVNQGTSSVRDDTTSIALIGGATAAGSNFVGRVKSAPVTPYTITARILGTMIHKPFQSYGLFFRESSSGKLHVAFMICSDDGLTTPLIQSSKFTNPTTFSADYVLLHVPQITRWWRIKDDGVNRIVQISHDGADWLTISTIGRTDFLTADQVGFGMSTENSAPPNFRANHSFNKLDAKLMASRFNVQNFLAEMRAEQREDHAALVLKVDEGIAKMTEAMSSHELEDAKQFGRIDKRLEAVENTKRTLLWLGATTVVAIVAGIVDFLFSHLPRFFKP
jgi:hypothetical protein